MWLNMAQPMVAAVAPYNAAAGLEEQGALLFGAGAVSKGKAASTRESRLDGSPVAALLSADFKSFEMCGLIKSVRSTSARLSFSTAIVAAT